MLLSARAEHNDVQRKYESITKDFDHANNIHNLLQDQKDKIIDVKFKTYGCGSAIASSSLFVDMLKGRTIDEAKNIKDKEIAKALELPPIKLHCSVLAEEAIRKAIADWDMKKNARTH